MLEQQYSTHTVVFAALHKMMMQLCFQASEGFRHLDFGLRWQRRGSNEKKRCGCMAPFGPASSRFPAAYVRSCWLFASIRPPAGWSRAERGGADADRSASKFVPAGRLSDRTSWCVPGGRQGRGRLRAARGVYGWLLVAGTLRPALREPPTDGVVKKVAWYLERGAAWFPSVRRGEAAAPPRPPIRLHCTVQQQRRPWALALVFFFLLRRCSSNVTIVIRTKEPLLYVVSPSSRHNVCY